MKAARIIELPPLESLPHATCKVCGRSLICGLFTPRELLAPEGPRCRTCIGDINARKPLKRLEKF